jgi:hypothetical protein
MWVKMIIYQNYLNKLFVLESSWKNFVFLLNLDFPTERSTGGFALSSRLKVFVLGNFFLLREISC